MVNLFSLHLESYHIKSLFEMRREREKESEREKELKRRHDFGTLQLSTGNDCGDVVLQIETDKSSHAMAYHMYTQAHRHITTAT